jgi:transposase-like protein
VINALPTSVQPTARRMLAEIRDAEDRAHAVIATNAFAAEFGAKWPKAVAKIVDDVEVLLTFFDFPAEHWIHLKTTDDIVNLSQVVGVASGRPSPRRRVRRARRWLSLDRVAV